MPRHLDRDSSEALVRGEKLAVVYADGFQHRIILEKPLPALPVEWANFEIHSVMSRPRDLYSVTTLRKVEELLSRLAVQHGAPSLSPGADT